MSPIVSRAELLRPWADAPCSCLAFQSDPKARTCDFCGGITSPHSKDCERCTNHSGLDKLYDALRCNHERVLDTRHEGYWCPDCNEHWWRGKPPLGIRTDLGALVRVAAACGLRITDMFFDDNPEQLSWAVVVVRWERQSGRAHFLGSSPDSPEDALAQALVAAIPERGA